jgi:hypothetical protein
MTCDRASCAIPKRVALHEHNGISGTNENAATVAGDPGVELVEIDQLAEPGYTCGEAAWGWSPRPARCPPTSPRIGQAAGVELLVLVSWMPSRAMDAQDATRSR